MTRIPFVLSSIFAMVSLMPAQAQHWSFKGTVVKMQMSECTFRPGLMSTLSGTPIGVTKACPEYTVVSDKVVYVVTGRRADEFMPLAEDVEFVMNKKNELVVFSDNEKSQSRFFIKEMTLRSDWDRDQQHRTLMMRLAEEYELRNSPKILGQTSYK